MSTVPRLNLYSPCIRTKLRLPEVACTPALPTRRNRKARREKKREGERKRDRERERGENNAYEIIITGRVKERVIHYFSLACRIKTSQISIGHDSNNGTKHGERKSRQMSSFVFGGKPSPSRETELVPLTQFYASARPSRADQELLVNCH